MTIELLQNGYYRVECRRSQLVSLYHRDGSHYCGVYLGPIDNLIKEYKERW